jgi:bifunctional UDP-N-acetylglucosamine pyrophosphorylase/glucosamine-1-phosphate N-acetyltransferase
MTAAAAVVLAAGQGTRMRSSRAKVLHELAGEPMIVRVMRRIMRAASQAVVVVGHQSREVESAVRAANIGGEIRFAMQREQRGTGDALAVGMRALDPNFAGGVLVAYGDVPMIDSATIGRFIAAIAPDAAVGFISVIAQDPAQFGRVVRNQKGQVEMIVEARDASAGQLAIREINTGVYFFPDARRLREMLADLRPDNRQGEYYLTDLIAIARKRGLRVDAWIANDIGEFAGINTREELASMEANIRRETNRKLMEAGVTLADPSSAYISEQAQIARDCVIGPNVQIVGRCVIGEGTRIEGTAWLSNVAIGPRCHIKLGVRAEDCVIGEDSEIGPFANLRAGTELAGHNRIGNFVETKKAKIGRGTKASHLSYLGDTTIGRDTNIGCGVITVNYDGYEKHHTEIGDRCMVGCDTQLVAPVKVGSDVYVASGTTIVREVADGALVMSHHPQREKSGWMASWRARHGDTSPRPEDD